MSNPFVYVCWRQVVAHLSGMRRNDCWKGRGEASRGPKHLVSEAPEMCSWIVRTETRYMQPMFDLPRETGLSQARRHGDRS
jgi:hypothetical protein